MRTTPRKLITIVAEPVLQDRLIQEIKRLGATGYTLSDASGEGTRGVHMSEWMGRNIRLEIIATPQVAERILEHLAHDYFRDFAVIAYVLDVDVVRGEKYGGTAE
jgi:nitrogen regulatory protein P-II 2